MLDPSFATAAFVAVLIGAGGLAAWQMHHASRAAPTDHNEIRAMFRVLQSYDDNGGALDDWDDATAAYGAKLADRLGYVSRNSVDGFNLSSRGERALTEHQAGTWVPPTWLQVSGDPIRSTSTQRQ